MKQAEKISPKPENQGEDRELTQKELEKVSGGLKAAPTVFDPELFNNDSLIGELGGRGGRSGDLGGGVV